MLAWNNRIVASVIQKFLSIPVLPWTMWNSTTVTHRSPRGNLPLEVEGHLSNSCPPMLGFLAVQLSIQTSACHWNFKRWIPQHIYTFVQFSIAFSFSYCLLIISLFPGFPSFETSSPISFSPFYKYRQLLRSALVKYWSTWVRRKVHFNNLDFLVFPYMV